MVLAQKQTYGSMQQNREPSNKPTHLQSINLGQRDKNIQWRKDSLLSTLNHSYVSCCKINIFSRVGLIFILLIQPKHKFWDTKRLGGWSKQFLLPIYSLLQSQWQNTHTWPLCVHCLLQFRGPSRSVVADPPPTTLPHPVERVKTEVFVTLHMHLFPMTKAFWTSERASTIDSDNS